MKMNKLLVAAALAASIAAPIAVSTIPARSTIISIAGRFAPSAMRMPISCVRSVIE